MELKDCNIEKEQLIEELILMNHQRIDLTKSNVELETQVEALKLQLKAIEERAPPTNKAKLVLE